jgi:hypothetical protein
MNKNILQLFFGIATVVFFVIVNLEYGIVHYVIGAIFSPLSQNVIFPLTASLAVISFLVISLLYRHFGIFSVWYGLTVTFLWIILFEILWQNSFIFTGNFIDTVTSEVILLSWFLMGTNSYPIWKIDKITGIAFVLFGVLWVLWITTGYQQINTTEGIVFNVITKILAFVVVMALVFPRGAGIHTKQPREETA